MCCFKKRRKATNCIAAIATLSILGGILMIAFTVKLYNMKVLKELSEDDGFDWFHKHRVLVYVTLLTIAILTILLSICGLFCRFLENIGWTVWYGVFLLPSFLILIASGSVFIALSFLGTDKVEEECSKLLETLVFKVDDESVKIHIDLQVYDAIFINTSMCTADCPCADVSTKNQWLNLTSD